MNIATSYLNETDKKYINYLKGDNVKAKRLAMLIDWKLLSGRIASGTGGGLATLVVLMAPRVKLIFRGSGGTQNGLPRAEKRPS